MITGNPKKRKKAFAHLKAVAAKHPNRDQLRDDDSIAMDDQTDDYMSGIYLALNGQDAL
jgi:hypothetical protein